MASSMETILTETSRAKGDDVRQEQVVKKQKEYKMIGRRKKVPGHTLFEFNVNTQELKPAMLGKTAPNRKVKDEDVRKFYELNISCVTTDAICLMYGICGSTIRKHIRKYKVLCEALANELNR